MTTRPHSRSIIVVDDDEEVRESMRQTLQLEGFKVSTFASGAEVLANITRNWTGIVISDLRMPNMDGMSLLDRIIEIDHDIPVVLISAYADIPVATRAMRTGAYDFVEKTDDPERLLDVVRRAMEKRQLIIENRRLQQTIYVGSDLENRLVGQTQPMGILRQTVLDLANADVDVLIYGETGTGKEVVARCLHDNSSRAQSPFVALNCGALAEGMVESELFGHEAGAFTGAMKQRIGKIEYADGGTLFLDEVESMPAPLQVRLLRVLQERYLERVGGNTPINVDIRVITASKIDLKLAVDDSRFREDLYYRLNVASIVIPSLADRRADIPLLFRYFADLAAQRYRRPLPKIDDRLNSELMRQSWPGNVRELRNASERFVLGLLQESPGEYPARVETSLTDAMDAYECQTIEAALRANQGHIENTAEALGIPRKTLYLRMKKYSLVREDFH